MDVASGVVIAGTSYVVNEHVIPAVTNLVIPTVRDHVFTIAKEEFRSVWYLKDNIDKISKLTETYHCAKEVAEKMQFEDGSVLKWLSDFKNVMYDVEDLECDYMEMVVSVEDGRGVLTRWMGHAKDSLFVLCGIPLSCIRDILPLPITPRIEIACRLRSINKNLARLEQRRVELFSLTGESSGNSNASKTGGTIIPQLWKYKEWPMIGRDKIKTEIKQALLNLAVANTRRSIASNLLVIGIVGAGGMGKTTLAHSIYNDKDVMPAFDLQKWFHLGDNFDLKEIMNKIIGDHSNLQNPDELYSTMTRRFAEESVLIIFDDVWCSDDREWELLTSSLSKGVKAHVLVMTTRNKAVAKVICRGSTYLEHELIRVSDDECMEIFKRWTFMGENVKRFSEFGGLSKRVVEKLKGVPLAAEIIGRLLSNHLDEHQKWINIVNNRLWHETNEGNLLIRSLD